MIEDIRQHMLDIHAYDESDIAPTLRSSDAELWTLHAHFHGEQLSAAQADRFFSTHVSVQLVDDDESDSEQAARRLREHGVSESDGVYANHVVLNGQRFGRCVKAVGIGRCTAATKSGWDHCAWHGGPMLATDAAGKATP